jgi:sugar lactone lactonase YvrE
MPISPDHLYPEVVLQHTCLLGEGPVWDANKKSILWIDLLNGIIHEFHTQDQSHHILELGDVVGAVVLTQSGNYLAALKSGLSIVNRTTGKIHFIHHLRAKASSSHYIDS